MRVDKRIENTGVNIIRHSLSTHSRYGDKAIYFVYRLVIKCAFVENDNIQTSYELFHYTVLTLESWKKEEKKKKVLVGTTN